MIYVEVDFLLALIKDGDWLGERAEAIYDEHREELWTSHYALVELLLVAYREDRNTERVVANASRLVEVRGDVETVLAAASYVEEHTGLRRSMRCISFARATTRSFRAIRRTIPFPTGYLSKSDGFRALFDG